MLVTEAVSKGQTDIKIPMTLPITKNFYKHDTTKVSSHGLPQFRRGHVFLMVAKTCIQRIFDIIFSYLFRA